MFYAYTCDGVPIAERTDLATLKSKLTESYSAIVTSDGYLMEWSKSTPFAPSQKKIVSETIRKAHTARLKQQPEELDESEESGDDDDLEDSEDSEESEEDESEEESDIPDESSNEHSEDDEVTDEMSDESADEQPKRVKHEARKPKHAKPKCAHQGCKRMPGPPVARTTPKWMAGYCLPHRRSIASRKAAESRKVRKYSLIEINQLISACDKLGGLERINKILKLDEKLLNTLLEKT